MQNSHSLHQQQNPCEMQKIMRFTVIFQLPFLLCSCSSTKNIEGIYRSRFAVSGFFGTKVNLRSDSTFTYRMRGDLVYDTAAGHYQTFNSYVILNYKPLAADSSAEYNSAREMVAVHEAITGNHNLHEPTRYLIGYKKLFLTDKKGHKVKRQWGYSRHKRYILFGSHWHMKRYYLKKVS
jgi:hypothetical protein